MINQHDWRGPTPPTLELSKCRQLVTFRLIQNIECARKLAIDSYLFITCLMEEVRNLQEGERIL
ncbi:Uncharacterised protein [Enterobacter kobei]|nr:Uncharacterised protein [Enterobacter kobei]